MKDISPLTGHPARLYCRKPQAEYYIADGLIYQKTPPTVEQMAAYAEREYSTGVYKDYIAAAPLKTATFRRRIKRLKKLGTKGRLLDVGCGCGFFIQVALEEGFDAYGIDFSHAARAAAAEEIQPRITIGDVNSLRRRGEEPFDVVVAFDIIEHSQNPLQFLREIRSVLRPDGWLMLSTPDTDHFLRFVMRTRWPMLQPMQHTHLFSKRAMQSALEKAGYRNISLRKADKTLTLDYVLEQVRVHNPWLTRIYRTLAPLLPRALHRKAFTVNIGEFLAFAQPQMDAGEDRLSAKSPRGIADVSSRWSSLAPHEEGGC